MTKLYAHKNSLIAGVFLTTLLLLLSGQPLAAHPPQQTTADIPPFVVESMPQAGATQPLEEPLQITFDQPMAPETVAAALTIEPDVTGALSWDDDQQTLTFTPTEPFERGQQYLLRISATAESAAGLSMNRPFALRFQAAGFLDVTSVQPAAGDSEILPETTVTVAFNRPVVPLTALEQQRNLPNPLTFEPPVSGEGAWLNTSIYQFTPADGFAPATTYTARVSAGLQAAASPALLVDDYEWQFSTITPAAIASLPAEGDIFVSPTPVISVAFNQPMNRQSVQQNLTLINQNSGETVPLNQFQWAEQGLTPPADDADDGFYGNPYDAGEGVAEVGRETVAFSPAEALTPETSYTINLTAAAMGQTNDIPVASPFTATFTTIAAPQVVNTMPRDGNEFVEEIWRLSVVFNVPMDPASMSIGEDLLLEYYNGETTGTITKTDVFSYWSNNNTEVYLNIPAQWNSSYTMTIRDSVTNRYGMPLADDVVVTWQTLNQIPAIRLLSPRIGTYNAYEPTRLYFTARNINQADFRLYQVPQEELIFLAGQYDWSEYVPDEENLVQEYSMAVEPTPYKNFIYELNLGEEVTSGVYFLQSEVAPDAIYEEAAGRDINLSEGQAMVVVSRYNLTLKSSSGSALAWLTDLQTGQPVGELPVSFMGRSWEGGTEQLGQATTDADGVALIEHDGFGPQGGGVYFAFAGEPFSPDYAMTSSEWNEGIQGYDFRDLRVENYLQPYNGLLYTDRNLYRAGQTVYFKGIIRADDDTAYSVPPPGTTVSVEIYDAEFNSIYRENLPLNEMGTFNGELSLSEDASLGAYSLNANLNEQSYFGHMFNVAAYRKPEFLVAVSSDKAEYAQNETITVTVNTEYFAGGPVYEASVRWSVLSDDYSFTLDDAPSYSFADVDEYGRAPWDTAPGFGEEIASGEGLTDRNGQFTFELPADITGKRNSQQFTIEAVVTGLNNQEVAAQTMAVVHKGAFYVGLRPENYVGQANEPNPVELLVVDWQGEPMPTQQVELIFAEQRWYSVQRQNPELAQNGRESESFYWENLVESVALVTTTVSTNEEGEAVARFSPQQGGAYKIYARAMDDADRQIFSSTYLWVSGGGYINWGQENNSRLQLVADQDEYQVGDVAEVLIPHSYSDTVQALVTMERGHVYSYSVRPIDSNSERLQIPITEEMIPNMFVSVVLVEGSGMENPTQASTAERALPSMKLGYVNLPISPLEKQLQLTVTPESPEQETYQPGETVTFNINVTDYAGEPVQAELSLALIDKAILTLAPMETGRFLETFWRERGLGVGNAAGLTLAVEQINRTIDAKKGGGGGGGPEGLSSVREEFADVPLWEATFMTDDNGMGSVEVTLPDNLTTWVMLAKGVTADETLVGEQRTEIVSTKPLLIRPVTPRFMVVGDTAQIGMIVQNRTAEAVTMQPYLEATGLDTGLLEFTPRIISAGQQIKLDYELTVPPNAGETAVITMAATAIEADLQDAVSIAFPLFNYSLPETVATVGVLSEEQLRHEGLVLPDSFDPSRGDLTISLEPTLAAGMLDGLDYLSHYPYESTEGTVSRFLPNILTYRTLEQLGLNRMRPNSLVATALQRLYNRQNTDGGWGWWNDAPSDPFMTAYVALGLLEARRAEFAVDSGVFSRTTSYLQEQLTAPQDTAAAWQHNQQAFLLYVLAEAGQGDFSRATTLFERRETLDYFGRAYLAMAMSLDDPDAPEIDTLLADLTDGALVSATGAHWEEEQVDYYAMNTDTRSTAIIVAALSRLQPDNPLLPQAVRWLMSNREHGGHWETTQETAWAIISLTAWMQASGELAADYRWQVSLNGESLAEGMVDSDNLTEKQQLRVAVSELLADSVNRLTFARQPATADETPTGKLYYAAYLSYFKPVELLDPLDRGIIVSRQYRLQGAEAGTGMLSEAAVGDVIEVKLTIVAPTDLHYVQVEDPFPAGTEAIDSSLATTSIQNQQTEFVRTDEQSPWGGNQQWFAHSELQDEKATLFATYLPKGTYEYTYLIRASLPGQFHVIPTQAEQVYFPEVFGRSDGMLFTINQ